MSLILPNLKRTSYILSSFFILLLIHLFHSWTVPPLPLERGLSTGRYEQGPEGSSGGESSRLEGLKGFVGSKGAGMWDSIGASWSRLGSGLGYHDDFREQLLEEDYEQEQGGKGEEDRKMLVESLDSLLEKLPVQWPANQTEREARSQTLTTLKSIRECLQLRSCGSNQLKLVLAGTGRWGKFFNGHTSGENIWARSSIDAFTALGHPILYTYDALETLLIYQHIPSLVHWVFVEQGELNDCLQYGVPRRLTEEEEERANDFVRVEVGERGVYGWQKLPLGNGRLGNGREQSGCIKRDGFEMGIPAWKMFIWSFWGGDGHPFGKLFTMVPEDLIWADRDPNHNNFFLGYSVQAYAPPDPPAKDPDAPIFVLAKVPDYFDEKWFAFWDNDTTFETLSEETGLSFVAGAGAEPGGLRDKGIENKGRFTKEGFYEMLQATGVLMGCGRPTLSPSPYDALVRGTPFINPVVWWNKKDPEDRRYWKTQHDALKMLDPPYVYNVFKGDLEGLRDALVAAHNTSIPSFTPEWMSTEANIVRHKEFTEKDWRAQAEDELQRQRNNDQIRIKGLSI